MPTKVPAAARSISWPPRTLPVKLMKSKARPAISSRGGGVVEEDVGEEPLGQVREGLRQPLAGERRLAGVLQHHRVAGDQRRDDGVDRGQERVVPGRDRRRRRPSGSRARYAAELVAVLDHLRRQRPLGDPGHVGGALAHAAHLAAVADRPAHLPGELGDEVGVDPVEPRHALADQLDPLGERPRRPGLLRGARRGEPRADAVGRLRPGAWRRRCRPPARCTEWCRSWCPRACNSRHVSGLGIGENRAVAGHHRHRLRPRGGQDDAIGRIAGRIPRQEGRIDQGFRIELAERHARLRQDAVDPESAALSTGRGGPAPP